MEKRRLSLLESKQVLISLVESVGKEGGEDGDCGSGDVRVREIEIGVNTGNDDVPEIGGETSGADKIEGKLFGDDRGKGSNDFFDGRFGELFLDFLLSTSKFLMSFVLF